MNSIVKPAWHLPPRQDKPLFNVAAIRQMEQDLFTQKDSFTVMQGAARSVFEVILPTLNDAAKTVHIILGSGNNAGDGLVLAALLKQAGQRVIAYRVFDKAFTGDAEKACQMAVQYGVCIQAFTPFACQPGDIIVEAIFGIGFDRPANGLAHDAIQHINRLKNNSSGIDVYAVDIPAGIVSDTGQALGVFVQADNTITFIADKIGLHTADGKAASGIVHIATLGANRPCVSDTLVYTYENAYEKIDFQALANKHKGNFGHALIVGGGTGMFGAAALSAVSSLKAGAGKASIYAHPDYHSQYHLGNTPLYEVMRCTDLSDISAYSAVVLGTGLGRTAWSKNVFAQTRQAVQPNSSPLLLDADGLYHLADTTLDNEQPVAVITPHEAEAARLLHTDVARIRRNKPAAVKQLAKQFSCVAVLKGAGTLTSDGQCVWINPTGNINLASAGTGDVLAGMIGGYLAQGFAPLDAALYGVYRHGLAADRYARQHTGKSLRASELWDYL
ncbi:MAG: hypothetical protein CR975_03615 [Gammaproteobacteria bacterium]|nr:MAG: hypothetical protein CR975_03615 [Gammaproteobacteria bacterium]